MNNHGLDAGIALCTAAQIRQIELNYASKCPKGTYPLMQAAGKAAYQQLKQFWPHAKRILVLTGKGNNGGDGFEIARLAAEDHCRVTLCNFCDEDKIKGDALIAYQQLPLNDIEICHWTQLDLTQFEVIVDALLGTGISGAVREPFIQVIDKINQCKLPILAVDIPSGLNADTGSVVNVAVEADLTVTFIAQKRGMYTANAADYRGVVRLQSLDIPSDCFVVNDGKMASQPDLSIDSKAEDNPGSQVRAENWSSVKYQLIPRQLSAHKGHFGHCQLIGGANGMAGAIILAASAAARCGSGLVSAWLQDGAASLLAQRPEVMAGNVTLEQIEQQIQSLATSVNCLVVGPGLGQSVWSHQWMQQLADNSQIQPLNKIWDADALNWLAQNPNFDERRILTPHPGEAARLLEVSVSQVNQDRYGSSQAIAEKYGGVCVLKGAGSVISDAHGTQVVCAVGNPGMASGGMGDVLSGIIGGLLAQRFSLFDAAILGVCIHGEAGDRAAGQLDHFRGMLASDLIGQFAELLNP